MILDSALGPWRPDLPDLNNPGVTVARNVTPGIGSFAGGVTYNPLRRAELFFDTSMESRPTGTAVGQDQFGTAKVYGGCASRLYKLSPQTHAWTDVSRSGGYLSGDRERWNSVEFGSYQILTNFNDAPQYIDMNTDDAPGAKFAPLTSLVRGRYVGTHKGHVILANTSDPLDGAKPNRVRWSGLETPADWAFSAQTGADFQDIHGYGAIQGIVCNDSVWIYMQRAVVQGTYIGAPYVFRFDTRVEGKGCTIPESLIAVEGKSFFFSDDGFYMHERGDQLAPIGIGKINKHFIEDADPGFYQFMSVVADPRETLIYWSYVSTQSPDNTPDKMLIYNYQTGEWSEAQATTDFLFSARTLPWTIDQLDIYGSIDNVPASFDDPMWAGGNSIMWGMDMNGAIYSFSGPTLPAVIETQEQHLINAVRAVDPRSMGDRTNVLGVRPLFEGAGGTVAVAVGSRSLSNGDVSWSLPSTTHPDTGFAPFRLQGRFHRVRLQLNGEWQKAIALQIDANSAGFR